MKNIRVKMKLIVSFLTIAIIAAIVGAMGVYGLLTLNSNEAFLYKLSLTGTYASDLAANIQNQRVLFRDIKMNLSDLESVNATIETWKELDNQYLELSKFLNDNLSHEQSKLHLSNIAKHYAAYTIAEQNIWEAGRTGDEALSNQALQESGAAVSPMLEEIRLLNAYIDQVASQTNDNDGKIALTLTIVVAALAFVAIASAIGLGLYIAGLISKPLNFMKDVLRMMGQEGVVDFSEEEYRQAEAFAKSKDETGESIGMLIQTGRRMEQVGQSLKTVAAGDLSAEVSLLSERDTIGSALKEMLHNLNSMFAEINTSTAQVSAGSKQIADGSQGLAQGSTEQAAAVEQLSSSISEIAEKTNANAKMANEAAALAVKIMDNAQTGSQQMDEMTAAVQEINQASQSINKVIKVIDDIAFQTNILALNAAVEAARAGQHGKGFAVVAEEVRNLAAKSAEAAKDTGGLIANSMEKAELGARIADETAASLAEIVSGINQSTTLVTQIARSSEEQATGISQVNKGIDQVAQVVQQNSATAEQSAAASQEMSGQAGMLEQMVAQFKLKDAAANRY